MTDATTVDLTSTGTQLAQATAEQIGSVVSANGDVTITRVGGETVTVDTGTPLYADDSIVTGPGSSIGFEFVDLSTFSLGESAQIILDELVYDPGADSSMVVNLVAGTFSFVSGEIAKSGDDSMQITTPVATIGVRGTAGTGDPNSVVLLQEANQPPGEISYSTQGGSVTLTQPNQFTGANSPFDNPSTPTIIPLSQIQNNYGSALSELPVTLPANENIQRRNRNNNNDDDGESGDSESGEEDADTDEDAAADGEGEEGEDTAEGEGEEEVAEGEGEEELAEGEGEDGEDTAEGEDGEDTAEGEGGEDVAAAGGEAGEGGDGSPLGGDGGGFGASQPGPVNVAGQQQEQPPSDPEVKTGDPLPPPSDPVDPPKTVQQEVVATQPPPPPPPPPPPEDDDDEVVDDDGDGEGVDQVGGTIEFNDSGTATLTEGDDQILLGAASININILGTAQTGDTFTDSVGSEGTPNGQSITFLNDGAHTFTVDEIEEVDFSAISNPVNVTVLGTVPVTFDNLGNLDITITGDSGGNDVLLNGADATSLVADVSLGDGTDSLTLLTGVPKTVTVTNVETVQTLNSDNDITFNGGTVTLDSSGGTGLQGITLLNGADVTWQGADANVGSVNFDNGNETLAFTFVVNGGAFDGLGGTDTLDFSAGQASVINIANFENFIGGVGDDTVQTTTFLQPGSSFSGGGGADVLTVQGGTNTFSIDGFEDVASVGGVTDVVNLESAVSNVNFSLSGGGVDTINLSSAGPNTLSVDTTEAVNGGSANDSLTAKDQIGNIDLGAGTDILILDNGVSITANISNVELVNGQVGSAESLTILTTQTGTIFDLGISGGDNANFQSGGNNSATFLNVHQVISGGGDDNFDFQGTGVINIDLGGGTDTVTISAGSGTIFDSVNNVEFLFGGSFGDTIIVDTGLTSGGVYDGGSGSDFLQLGVATNTSTISSFETVKMAVANATLSLEAADSGNQLFSFSGGTNTFNLAAGSNVVTFDSQDFNSLDTINGNSGDDTLIMLGETFGGTIDLGGGTNDVVDASSAVSFESSVTGVESFVGTGNDDLVIMGNALNSGDDFDGGSDVGGGDTLTLTGAINTASIINFEQINVTAQNATVTLESDSVNQHFFFTVGGNTLDLGSFNQTVTVTSDAVGSSSTVILGGAGDQNVTTFGSITTVFDLGDGVDTITASSSASDIFFFGAASDSLIATPDVINNFDAFDVAEVIDFSAFAFSSFSFIGSISFSLNSTVEARFDDATDTLQVDTNDDGSTDMAIVLTGVNGADLDASDFTI